MFNWYVCILVSVYKSFYFVQLLCENYCKMCLITKACIQASTLLDLF